MINKKTISYENVPVKNMYIDDNYQRKLSEKKMRNITKNFDPFVLGTITLSEREGGKYFVVDGQHRVVALKTMNDNDRELFCVVIRGITPEEEAEIFDKTNVNRGPVATTDRFRSRLFYGDPQAVDIEKIVNESGFRLNLRNHNNYRNEIQAIGALEKIYKMGPGYLKESLTLVKEIWQGEGDSLQSQTILGVATFTKKYNGEFDRDRLIKKLSTLPISKLMREAKAITELDGGHSSLSIAKVIMKYYNKNIVKNRLPNKFIED